MEINFLWLTYVALLLHLAAGLDTKMFQLTMPNVRPYRVSISAKIQFHMLKAKSIYLKISLVYIKH